jgi:hypothetical protein
MELLDRYLKAVRGYLPKAQRDDIIKELSEDIHSQIDEKEAELGHPLDESEVEAILRRQGNPLLVAGRYRQDSRSFSFGRQIIGPRLFPFYIKVLSFNLGITAIVLLVIFTALIAGGEPFSFLANVPTVFLYQLIIQFGIVTFIFALMDQRLAKFPDRWDPRKPAHPYHPSFGEPKDIRRVPRMESTSRLIALCIAVVWLRTAGQYPIVILGPAAAFLKLAPVWHQLYEPLMILALLGMVQAAVSLFRPDWVWLSSGARIAGRCAGLVIAIVLLRADTWVTALDDASYPSATYLHVVAIVNQTFYWSLWGCIVLSLLLLARDLVRLAGKPRMAHDPNLAA